MRVPVIDAPSVATSERAGYRPQLRNPDTSLEQGLQSLGRGIETVVVATEGYVAKADELRRTEALTQYQKDVTAELQGDSSTQGKVDAAFDGRPAPTGFLNTKGTEASAQSAELLQRLEKRRQELGATLNDRQRAGFLERSAAAYEGARGRIESHVGQQFRAAQVATADAAKQAYLDAVASGSADPVDLERQRVDVEKSVAALSLSPEDAAADVAKLRGDAAVGAISAALANDDVDTAAQQLEARRAELGTRYPQVKHQVDVARKGRDQDVAQGEADKQVAAWADEVRSKDGFVAETDLRAKAKDVPADKQRFFEHSLDRHVRNEAAKKEDAIKAARDVANRADLDRQQIPGAAYEFLRQHDPDFLLAREARKRAEFRAWKASQSDTRGKAAEAKLQKAVDQEFLNLLGAELTNRPDADPEEFLIAFVAKKAKEGDDVTVSDVARARASFDAAKAGQRAKTAEGATDRAVSSRLQATLEKQAKSEAKGPVDQQKLNARVGAAMALYHAELERNGGKPLDESQLSKLEQQMVSDVRLDRTFWGTKSAGLLVDQPVYGPEAPPKPPAAATTKRPTATGKNGEKYQLSEDGKSWEPIK